MAFLSPIIYIVWRYRRCSDVYDMVYFDFFTIGSNYIFDSEEKNYCFR